MSREPIAPPDADASIISIAYDSYSNKLLALVSDGCVYELGGDEWKLLVSSAPRHYINVRAGKFGVPTEGE